MELFLDTILNVRALLAQTPGKRSWPAAGTPVWPAGGGRNIVLREDMGLELGSPQKESLSCLLWTQDSSLIEDGRITLAGPDLPESQGMSLPFGKVVLAAVEGFTEDNAYDRHKDLDYLRYDLDLKGFMMRSASQYLREWCRIAASALRGGFSVRILGAELIRLFRTKPYVKAIEVVCFTSSPGDVARLREITSPAERIIAAMNKMAGEFDFDCSSCDYRDVCDEADGLKGMRDRLRDRTAEARHG
jgi:CO dehydrogenase/acetyl-CoA synthase beta subunit